MTGAGRDGRRPRTAGLGLDRVSVRTDGSGFVQVDDTMRTTGRNIFAAGDVTGRMPFTHIAGAQGNRVVTNALFRPRRTVDEERIPWTIFTDPEVAHVGLTEGDARRSWGAAWPRVGAQDTTLPVLVPHLLVAAVAVLWLGHGGLADRLLTQLPIDVLRARSGIGIVLVYLAKEVPFRRGAP